MATRSAEASIKGYYYQFFHSIKDILSADENDEITIEGIEDLDIEAAEEKELIQYKYHENKTYTNSEVGKPIRIMFKHFMDNEDIKIKYKLFIYLCEEELPELNNERLKVILKLTPKGKVDTIAKDDYHKIDNDNLLDKFLGKFEWRLTKKFDELESDIIRSLQENFSLTEEESKIVYLPNGLKIINDLAINSDEAGRKITNKKFLEKLNNLKGVLHTSYIMKRKGFQELKKIVRKRQENLGIKSNQSNYIVYIKEDKLKNTPQLIINLSKKFFFKGNSFSIKSPTFIIHGDIDRYKKIKKEVSKLIATSGELILFNDGGEDYHFNKQAFNRKPLVKKNRGGNKVDQCGYNFKILHYDIFMEHKDDLEFTNKSFYFLGFENNLYEGELKKAFAFKGLNNEEIIEVIGG